MIIKIYIIKDFFTNYIDFNLIYNNILFFKKFVLKYSLFVKMLISRNLI